MYVNFKVWSHVDLLFFYRYFMLDYDYKFNINNALYNLKGKIKKCLRLSVRGCVYVWVK